jgi:hypothetical protein
MSAAAVCTRNRALGGSRTTTTGSFASSWAGLAACLAVALASGCVEDRKAAPLPGNVLANAKADGTGVANRTRLTDGLAPREGDFWDTPLTARFETPQGQVTWDLGTTKKLAGALVQGDNNDVYTLSGSDDGTTWKPLWQAGPVDGAGMRLRQTTLAGSARYVRLTGSGGDGLFSSGEVAVFEELPKGWPTVALIRSEGAAPEGGDAGGGWGVSLGVLAAAALLLVFLSRRRKTPAPATASSGAPPDPSSGGAPPAAP